MKDFDICSLTEPRRPGERFAYSDAEIPGGIPNGTLVEKCLSEPDDAHPDGALARVMGALGDADGEHGYFVEWLDKPGLPVFVKYTRIRPKVQP